MSKRINYIGSILPLAIMLNEMNKIDENIYLEEKPSNKLKPTDIEIIQLQKRPAKGCKEYFFNKQGKFYNGEGRPMLKSETVFYCHANNDKNAIRKFNNWLKLQDVV